MSASPKPGFADCAVVELRRYTLHPGTFDQLLNIFQTSLMDGLEESGMRLGGLFRDLGQGDRFVWFRGFASMEQRCAALNDFYYGPIWRAHSDAANVTMLDSDDVLLLRPTDPEHRPVPPADPQGDTESASSSVRGVVGIICHEAGADTDTWLATDVHARLEQIVGTAVATWHTEPATNTFPALPVRSDHAFVWLAVFDDDAAAQAAIARLDVDAGWAADIAPRLAADAESVERMLLQPTARSRHPQPSKSMGH